MTENTLGREIEQELEQELETRCSQLAHYALCESDPTDAQVEALAHALRAAIRQHGGWPGWTGSVR